jgi:hypothetical protein
MALSPWRAWLSFVVLLVPTASWGDATFAPRCWIWPAHDERALRTNAAGAVAGMLAGFTIGGIGMQRSFL